MADAGDRCEQCLDQVTSVECSSCTDNVCGRCSDFCGSCECDLCDYCKYRMHDGTNLCNDCVAAEPLRVCTACRRVELRRRGASPGFMVR